ncbi:MAG: YbaK/EbsC family protein [Candidatus Pacearchaeota archaeon]|jgi:prolyl-tRNA editing enzyme YbaK/EbsC (Cys-tRNA(Pro) deacylase)
MYQDEEKLKKYIVESKVQGEHLSFSQSCHTVKEAATTAKADPLNFVKNICMIDANGQLIVAIIKGEDRASTSQVAKALNIERPRLATEEEILKKTGYPSGGIPSFGYPAKFLIDPRVMEKEIIYTGGGSKYSLVKIASKELVRINNGIIFKIRK